MSTPPKMNAVTTERIGIPTAATARTMSALRAGAGGLAPLRVGLASQRIRGHLLHLRLHLSRDLWLSVVVWGQTDLTDVVATLEGVGLHCLDEVVDARGDELHRAR